MKEVSQIVAGFSGQHWKSGHTMLCMILEAALAAMPEERAMGELCREVSRTCRKTEEAVYKAAARAVRDIWEYGDRQVLEQTVGYRLLEEPTPKELVTSLTQVLWHQEAVVEYRVLESDLEGKFGILAQTSGEEYVMMPPFSRDEAAIRSLVEQWNREQMPLRRFREMILLDQLRQS